MFPLSTLSVIEFSGSDAGQFLHNQLSADIEGIGPSESGFACCCNPAGRVIALMLVTRHDDKLLAVCSMELAAPLVAWLSRFIIRADVKIRVCDELLVAGSIDRDAGAAEAAITLSTITGLNYFVLNGTDSTGLPEPGAESAWKQSELANGTVWLDNETTAKFLPQMLGFERIEALNFNKGCYPGQEIIARTRYLGKLKRRPILLKTASSIDVGIGEKLALISGEESSSAVLVDQIAGTDGSKTLFVVARAGEDFHPENIKVKDAEFKVLK